MVAAAMTALMPGAGPPPTRMARVFPLFDTTSLSLLRSLSYPCSQSGLRAIQAARCRALPFDRAGEADGIVADSGPRSITPLLAGDSAIVIVVATPLRGAATPGAAARTLSWICELERGGQGSEALPYASLP